MARSVTKNLDNVLAKICLAHEDPELFKVLVYTQFLTEHAFSLNDTRDVVIKNDALKELLGILGGFCPMHLCTVC